MPDEWSFNLRSCVLGADEDCDSDDDLSPNQLSTDTEFLREIDLSSRQDHAQYKPNPWSIAKVNAASRSKLPTPIRPAILTANTVTKPKGAIVEAFRKQAEKPKPKSTQQFAPVKLPPARVEVEPRSLASRNGAGCQQNASQTPSSSRLVTLTHTPISMDRVTPRSLRMTPTRAVVNHNSKDAHIATDTSFAQRNPAPSLGSHTLCNDLNTAGTPVGLFFYYLTCKISSKRHQGFQIIIIPSVLRIFISRKSYLHKTTFRHSLKFHLFYANIMTLRLTTLLVHPSIAYSNEQQTKLLHVNTCPVLLLLFKLYNRLLTTTIETRIQAPYDRRRSCPFSHSLVQSLTLHLRHLPSILPLNEKHLLLSFLRLDHRADRPNILYS